MNKKHVILIMSILIFLIVSGVIVYRYVPFAFIPKAESIVLTVEKPENTHTVDDKISIKATLKNNNSRSFTVTHGSKMIYITLVPEANRDQSAITTAIRQKKYFRAGQTKTETEDFVLSEPGIYYIKIESSFTVKAGNENKQYHDSEDVKIIVNNK